MMAIFTLQQYYNAIIILQQHSIYNVLNGHCNVSAILEDFNGIFFTYFLNTNVLLGKRTNGRARLDSVTNHLLKTNEDMILYGCPAIGTVSLSDPSLVRSL